MEKKMEHEMETGGIPGLKEFHLVSLWGYIYTYIYRYTHYSNLITPKYVAS